MSVSENELKTAGSVHGQRWPIEIGGADLIFKRHMLRDPMPSGRQIIATAGHRRSYWFYRAAVAYRRRS